LLPSKLADVGSTEHPAKEGIACGPLVLICYTRENASHHAERSSSCRNCRQEAPMPQPQFFAGSPAPFLLDAPPPARGKRKQQLLWGDHVTLLGEESGDWVKVRGRNSIGWIQRSQLQQERLLEINWVDVGQGDGIFIVTPGDERILIDAGQG